MKARVLVLGSLLVAGAAFAPTLRPSMIVYGLVRDSYGLRLGPDSALVGAFLGTNEVARTTIRPQPMDANYRFEINVSDPLTAGPTDIKPGDTVTIGVRMGGHLQPSIGTNTFSARGDGASVNVNLILGEDTDHDGLPDDWEWLVIANSGGAISNLHQVGPGLDLDGDGVPDDQEFFLGTFAWLPDGELRLTAWARHSNGRLSFSFLPIPNLTYWVEFTPTLEESDWQICPISLTETGPLMAGTFTGGTQWVTFYVEAAEARRFWRLRGQ